MGTSEPVRKKHSIPIVEEPPRILPLSAPDPTRIVTPSIPIKQPEQAPVRRVNG